MTGESNNINADIDLLTDELQKLSEDPANDLENRRFAEVHAAQVTGLLEELKSWRESAEKRRQDGRRVIIEGFDEDSAKGAFADALNKAARFFNEQHDVSITVLELSSLPRAGHRAMLEVDLTPLSHKVIPHPLALEEEAKQEHDREYAAFRKFEETHLRELVLDHFLVTSGTEGMAVPDYFLINFTDAQLMNHMIEKEFFKAGKNKTTLDNDEPAPRQAIVRVLKKED